MYVSLQALTVGFIYPENGTVPFTVLVIAYLHIYTVSSGKSIFAGWRFVGLTSLRSASLAAKTGL